MLRTKLAGCKEIFWNIVHNNWDSAAMFGLAVELRERAFSSSYVDIVCRWMSYQRSSLVYITEHSYRRITFEWMILKWPIKK